MYVYGKKGKSAAPKVLPLLSQSTWSGNTAALESNGVSITVVNPRGSNSSVASIAKTPTPAPTTSNGVSCKTAVSPSESPPVLEDYSVKCDNCGRLGVKSTYKIKQKNFCSVQCSKIMGKPADRAPKAQVRPHAAITSDADAEDIDGSSRCSSPVDGQSTVRSSSSASNSVNDYDAEGAPKNKKKKVEVDPTFDWKTMMNNVDFKAASVGLMKHAPLSRMWDNVTIGMKLEVENKDIDPRNHQIAFWVASVVKIQGYLVLLRFEGFGNDPTGDFWINLCSHDIHHVGWCANKGKPLIPPRSISRKFTDWRNFLVNRLTGARTLPQNFQAKVQSSLKSKYEVGDQLEVVDKNRICQLRLATVRKIVGRRLHVEYFDSTEDGACAIFSGFWCHEESRLIHPKGWAKTIGHEIVAPRHYNPNELLPTPYDKEFEEMDLQVGMKLEAIDPLNLSAICAATIKKVLRRGYVMVRVDSYEEDSSADGSDWFCYHISSPYVFPCGFCEENGITLTPPKKWEDNFQWTRYLTEIGARAAPVKQKKTINHKYKAGMKVEAADLMDPRLICVATISHIVGRLLKIHFDGWEEEYDQWLDARSPDIYPVGWCELVNHKLEAPRPPQKPLQPVKKGKKGKKKGPVRGGKVGPGRPPKSTTPIPPSSTQVVKKAALPKVETTEPIPAKASAVGTTSRRSSIQQQAQQLKVEQNATSTVPEEMDTSPIIASPPESPVLPKMEIDSGTNNTDSESIGLENLNGGTRLGGSAKTESTSRKSSTDTESSSTGVPPKIPILSPDNLDPSCCENVDPSIWGPKEVVAFLDTNGCGDHSDGFLKNKISGSSLLALTKDQIVILTGMKVGPALKILSLIDQLKRSVKSRNALGK
ncbi:unnamed protein product [Orchesella dallaii]|uniref:Polycomb protein Sfmbt n=1 Tax=Orchesella dallaii TaxID=48710 RepID=A0ABP1Q2C5_9HEXA